MKATPTTFTEGNVVRLKTKLGEAFTIVSLSEDGKRANLRGNVSGKTRGSVLSNLEFISEKLTKF